MQFVFFSAINVAVDHRESALRGTASTVWEIEVSERAAGGIQSLDGALHLLKVLAAGRAAMTLTDLARAADMPVPKAHRYLASFAAAGLVEQRARSGRYDLGPAALSIGLAAMARSDVVNRTAEALVHLTDETGHTALLSIWGDQGSTVVRWERSPTFFVTSLGLGAVLPLLDSATGRVFLAHLPKPVTENRLRGEMKTARGRAEPLLDGPSSRVGVSALVAQTRADGFASVDGRFIPGLAAIAAPVLDWQGDAALAVTLIAKDPGITAPDGVAVQSLKAFCRSLSAQ